MKQIVVFAIGLLAIAGPALAQTAEQLNNAENQRLMTGAPPPLYPAPPMAMSDRCPAGAHWVEGSYARHAKWRDAGCARN